MPPSRDQPAYPDSGAVAVAQQTAQEGQDIGIGIKQCADQADVIEGINITNYDRLIALTPARSVAWCWTNRSSNTTTPAQIPSRTD